MSNQTKIITSHRSRVKRAEEARKNSPEKISIFDREAFVEFYLLEDIVRLYEYRLKKERDKNVTTRAGEMARQGNIAKFAAIINIFKSAIEIAWSQIDSGNYKAVWSAIPEHALTVAANNIKYLPQLRELAVKLLKTLSEESTDALRENKAFEESLDALDDHAANVNKLYELPSAAEIEELIRAVEVAIPDEAKTKQSKIKPQIN